MIKNVYWSSCKVLLFLSDFNATSIVLTNTHTCLLHTKLRSYQSLTMCQRLLMSMTFSEYLTVEMIVSCSNQLTVFPVQYLLHSVFVLAEAVGVHDELVAWEFVAAAAKNIEQYLMYLQNHKNGIKFYNIPFTFKLI